jgi:hypothetical protein
VITVPGATYRLAGAGAGVQITYSDAAIPARNVPMSCNFLVECGKLLP